MRVAEIGPFSSASRGDQGEAHAEGFGALGEECGAAAAAVAEREIRAADQVAGAETLVEDFADEGFGRHQAECVVEFDFVEQGYAEGGQGFGALGGQGQAERRVVGAEMLARVGFEG